jgi:altronate hydrolase
MTVSALRLHLLDNVACLLRAHDKGEVPTMADGTAPPLIEPVAMGHKVALRPIGPGEAVVKYGATIGHATQPIPPGAHVHLHNLAGAMR